MALNKRVSACVIKVKYNLKNTLYDVASDSRRGDGRNNEFHDVVD